MRAMQRRNRPDEAGASMVEGAISISLVAALLFAVFQFALLGSAYLDTRNAANGGARSGAIAAAESNADYVILAAVAKQATMVPKTNIKRIVIFKAASTESSLDDSGLSACKTGSVTGVCNSYAGSVLTGLDPAVFGTGPSGIDGKWGPTTRGTSRTVGADLLGVFVQIESQDIGGLIPLKKTFEETSIVRLETTTS